MASCSGYPDSPILRPEVRRGFTFVGVRVDALIAREPRCAVQPMAIDAGAEAEGRDSNNTAS
jgi:hypothetical protein